MTAQETKLIDENAKLFLEVKKWQARCKKLGENLEKYETLVFHCGKCSKEIALDFMKKRSDENKIVCPECNARQLKDSNNELGK